MQRDEPSLTPIHQEQRLTPRRLQGALDFGHGKCRSEVFGAIDSEEAIMIYEESRADAIRQAKRTREDRLIPNLYARLA
jgi:hypothetical protein